jgi:chorismate lyase / 3-hydroxybenzoate synthase
VNGSPGGVPLRVVAGGADRLRAVLAGATDRLLLVVGFGRPRCAACPADVPGAALPNLALGDSPPFEAWLSDRSADRVRLGPLAWAEDGRVLFGSLESRLGGALEQDSSEHFAALLDLIEERGYPHLLRVWNFLPRINDEMGGVERYRRFNVGRAAAFERRYGASGAEARFSASSAVGTTGDSLYTFLAAARTAPRHLGNPRQLHAFRYPPEYGPRAPSFSRATVAPAELAGGLFLSGTASIEGHESRHHGSLDGQLEETLRNVETLLGAAGGSEGDGDGDPPHSLADFDLVRVYLRDPGAFPQVRRALYRRLRPGATTIFVGADICRRELLLELEGVALGPAVAAGRAGSR